MDTEEVPAMIRRLAAAAISAVLVAVIAGCSNDSADPSTLSAGTSSPVTATPSVADVGTATPPSPAQPVLPAQPTSTAQPTVGSTATTTSPWPSTLTPAQVADVKAALDVYSRYQTLVGVAGANPAKDWTNEISAVATAVAKSQLIEALTQTAARGQRTTGSTQISPAVTVADPSLVVVQDCIDTSDADFLDKNGKSIKAADAPGTYYRHPATAQIVEVQDGTWRVAASSDDWSRMC